MTKTGEAARPPLDLDPESVLDTVKANQRPILIGTIVLAVIAGSFWFFERSKAIKEGRAEEAHAQAENAYVSGNLPLAQTELQKVVDRYKGTVAGTQSAMLLAQVLFDQGKYAEGIKQLEALKGSVPKSMETGVLALTAAGQEGEQKFEEAAKSYEAAAKAAVFEADQQQFKSDAARNYLAAGKIAEAKKLFEELAGINDSPYAGEARVRLGEIAVRS